MYAFLIAKDILIDFLICKSEEFLEKYDEILEKVSNIIKKEFNSEPVHNKKYLKFEKKTYNEKINSFSLYKR